MSENSEKLGWLETCTANTGNTDKSHGNITGTGSVGNDEEEDVVQG